MKLYAVAALAALIATPAFAQEAPQCGPLSDGLKQLATQYKEFPVWVGRSGDTEMMLTQSADKRTWTWLGIKFQGDQAVACIFDSGKDAHIQGTQDDGSVALFVPRGAAKLVPGGRM